MIKDSVVLSEIHFFKRPWGSFEPFASNENCTVGVMTTLSAELLSLQSYMRELTGQSYKPVFFLVLFFGSLLCSAQISSENEVRPNILWIVSEDNSPLLGCYGDEFATTPNLDKFAKESVLYENAFSSGPACAISRATIITGMYASTLGTENMRSNYTIPDFIKFFPKYLQEAGYYVTNNGKEDYNIIKEKGFWDRQIWDESSRKATYKNRKPDQPFFAVFNLGITHESRIHKSVKKLNHDKEKVPLPPYHPATSEMKFDWAHYYDQIEKMDRQVGSLLQELEESGLAENTIVFYYSDHGGALGGSKRFMKDAGLRVPLIIRTPEKFRALAPEKPGSRTNKIVSFEDFAPTILNLTGIEIPAYMEGTPFLGIKVARERKYAYGFRGRIDEVVDFVRTIRNKKYRYVRNYMPHKIYGQYNEYMWRAASLVSWENSYKGDSLNAVQAAFWEEKPTEELYDVVTDPHNVNNLAGDKKYQPVLEEMRRANRKIILDTKDTGFIPEAMKARISKTSTSYDFARSNKYPLERILETAEMATTYDAKYVKELNARLGDKNSIVRYWAAMGCTILGKQAQVARPNLVSLLSDSEPAVRIAAAEALYGLGEVTTVIPVLAHVLEHSSNEPARLQAVNVLKNMGQKAQPALPVLKNMVNEGIKNKKKMISDHDTKVAKRILKEIEL